LLGSEVSIPVDTGAEIIGEAESVAAVSVDVPEEDSTCSADGISYGASALVVGLATATVLPKVSNVGRTARVATYRYGQKGFRVMAGIQSEILDAVKQRLLRFEARENSYTTKSVDGFANVRSADPWLAGVGANWTEPLCSLLATGSNANHCTSQLQGFAALQYLLSG
jgi:hypothetical protein